MKKFSINEANQDEQDPYTGKVYKEEEFDGSRGQEADQYYKDIAKGAETLKDIINLPYAEFIQKLTGKTPPTDGKDVADIDPKVTKVLSMGKSDLKLEDEKVPVNTEANTVATSLFPTQAQIGLKDSIGFLAFILPDAVKNPLSGQAQFKNKKGEVEKILTANGKYILDGHHRWSQTYIINPQAKVPSVDLGLKVSSEEEMLKVIQLAIASTYGKISMSAANADTDIYNPDILKKWNAEYKIGGDTTLGLVKAVLEGKCGIPDGGDIKNVEKFIDIIKEAKGLENREAVEKYLAGNADMLRNKNGKPESAPARAIMPQPGDTASAAGKGGEKTIAGIPAEFVNKLSSGKLNFKADFLPKDFSRGGTSVAKESKYIKTFEQFRRK